MSCNCLSKDWVGGPKNKIALYEAIKHVTLNRTTSDWVKKTWLLDLIGRQVNGMVNQVWWREAKDQQCTLQMDWNRIMMINLVIDVCHETKLNVQVLSVFMFDFEDSFFMWYS